MGLNLNFKKPKPSPTETVDKEEAFLNLSKIPGLDLSKPCIIFNVNVNDEKSFNSVQLALKEIVSNATIDELVLVAKAMKNPTIKALALNQLKTLNL